MNGWMDGWMDGWRRPNHMRSQIGGPKAMPPVNLRRLAGDLHSVAKQASFNIALRSNFKGFGVDFSRFCDAKMDAKTDILELCLQCFFVERFGIDVGWIFGDPKLEKSIKSFVLS